MKGSLLGLAFVATACFLQVQGNLLPSEQSVELLGGTVKNQEGIHGAGKDFGEPGSAKKQFPNLSRSWSPVSSSSHEDLCLALQGEHKPTWNGSKSHGSPQQHSRVFRAHLHQDLQAHVDTRTLFSSQAPDTGRRAEQDMSAASPAINRETVGLKRTQSGRLDRWAPAQVNLTSGLARIGSWRPHSTEVNVSVNSDWLSEVEELSEKESDHSGSHEILERSRTVRPTLTKEPVSERQPEQDQMNGVAGCTSEPKGSSTYGGGFWLPGMGTLSSPAGVHHAPVRSSRHSDQGWPVPSNSWKPKYDMTMRKEDFQPAPSALSAERYDIDTPCASSSQGSLGTVEVGRVSPVLKLSKVEDAEPDYRRLCESCGNLCSGAWVMGYDRIHCSQKCLKSTENKLGTAAKSWDSFEYQRSQLTQAV